MRARTPLPTAVLVALALGCGSGPEPRGPCMSDVECRGDRICHEGRCRFEHEVRAELEQQRVGTSGGASEIDGGLDAAIATPPPPTTTLVDASTAAPVTDASSPVASPAIDERPSFMGGPRHTGRTAARGPASDPTQRWVYRTGARVYASPVVGADGTIYVGSTDRTLVALTPAGTLRFRYTGGDRFYATAALDREGHVIVGNHDGSVVSLTAAGQVRWRRELGTPVDASAALGDDGTIYVTADGLHALDPARGADRWHVVSPSPVRTSPAIHPAGLVIFATPEGRVTAVRAATGEVAWEHALGGSTDSSPAITDDGHIVIGDDLSHVTALDQDGHQVWQVTTEGDVRATPAIGLDGTIVVGSDDRRIYGISPRGEVRFRVATSGRVRSSARIDADGRIYVGSQDDFVYVLAPDGTQLYRHGLGRDVDSTCAIAPDGTLLVGVDDGGVYALR